MKKYTDYTTINNKLSLKFGDSYINHYMSFCLFRIRYNNPSHLPVLGSGYEKQREKKYTKYNLTNSSFTHPKTIRAEEFEANEFPTIVSKYIKSDE